jgi:acyl-CoA thioester hydrolase
MADSVEPNRAPPRTHVIEVSVAAEEIDVMGHANNTVYLRWLEQAAWSHYKALGIDWPVFQRLQRGMVAHRHELDYLAPCFEGDVLEVNTWIAESARVGFYREYRITRERDKKIVMRARTHWVCVDLETGRPAKMPAQFIKAYQP